jgi:hypothetical protein
MHQIITEGYCDVTHPFVVASNKPINISTKHNLDFDTKQDTQMYVIWGTFVQPFLGWKRNNYYIFWKCVRTLSYPACNAQAPYVHLWPVRLYNIFSHYVINCTIFEKRLLNPKGLFWLSLQLLSETFLIQRRNEQLMIRNVYWSSCKVLVILFHF